LKDAKLRYENQLYAAKELVKALSAEAPVVLEIEDSHWMEPSTAEWLKIMTRNVVDVPMLVVLTSRYAEDAGTGFRKPRVAVEKDVPVNEIELQGLDESQALVMFSARIGAKRRAAPTLMKSLMERTGGNPFFLEQMIAHLKDNGLLVESPEGMVLNGDIGRLPTTIDNVLLARFDRLDANLREGLKHAATLGVRFMKRVLEELLRRSEEFKGVPGSVLPDGEEQGMVVHAQALKGEAKDTVELSAEDAYLFRHALMQKAAYHLQMPSVRVYLHRLAAEVIEGLFPGRPEYCRELAEHYGKAEMPEKEIDCLEKAAKYAAGNYKNQEAVELYPRLIDQLTANEKREAVSDQREAQIRNPKSAIRIVKARYGLAAVYNLVGKWTEAIEEYEKGLALAEEGVAASGNREAAGAENAQQLSLPQDSPLVELVVDGQAALSGIYHLRGRMKEAMEIAMSAVALADGIGYTKGKANAISYMGLVYYRQGDYARAMECYRESYRLSEELGNKAGKGGTLGNMGTVYRDQGDYARAMECYQQWLQLAEELGDKVAKAGAIGDMGTVYIDQGDYARAMECYQKHLQLAEEIGDKEGKAGAIGNMGNVYLYQGDYTRAIECIQQALRIIEEIGHKAWEANAIGNMGIVYSDQCNYASAMECYEKQLQLSEELGDKAGKARAVGDMGTVYMDQGDYARAMECFQQAVQLFVELGDRRRTALVIGNMGVVHFSQGNDAQAMEFFQKDLQLCNEIGDKDGKARAIRNIGCVYSEQGDYARAMEYYQQLLQLSEELSSKAYTAFAFAGIGTVLVKTGDYEQAVEKLITALKLWEELKSRQEMTGVLVALAEAHLGLRNSECGMRIGQAREVLEKARALAGEFKQKKELEEIARVQKLLDDATGRH
jgi:tetratricopeptide (TPR) repeat protein